jgi:DNA-binding transcriptional ArsR family regulator
LHTSKETVEAPRGIALDAAALRAFAHPLRVRMYTLLEDCGPATASQLAAEVGESSGSTSYHLRQLARHGLIQDMPDRGKGKERWWRTNPAGFSFNGDAFRRDPSTAAAAEVLLAEVFRRRVDDLSRWLEESRTTPQDWVQASVGDRHQLTLTRPELAQLVEDVLSLLERYRVRSAAHRGEDVSTDHRPAPEEEPASPGETARVVVHFDAFPVGLGQ